MVVAVRAPQSVAPQPVEVLVWRRREAKYFQLGPGKFLGIFEPHLHYEHAPGVWEDTDLALIPVGPDHIMVRAFFHVRVTRTDIEISGAGNGKGVRWLNRTRLMVANGKVELTRDGLSWEYRVFPRGVKLSAIVAAARGPRTYVFGYRLLGGAADFTIDAEGNAQGDGFAVPRPSIVGSDRVTYDAGPWRLEPGRRLAFDFDDSALPPEAFPYVIDPSTDFDIAATLDDGFTQKSENVYPPTTNDLVNTGSNIEPERGEPTPSNFFITVGHMRWDTSSLADNATVTAADFEFHITQIADNDNRSLTLDWNDAVVITIADWVQDALTDAHAGTDITNLTNGVVNTLALINLSNVSLTGFTGLRAHVSGGAPTDSNRVGWRSFSASPVPRLAVTFTIPVPNITSVTPNEGTIDGGTSVTIAGTNLLNATSVTFGGTEVTSIDSNTDIEIVVTTAAHALGLVDVIVTTAGGSDTDVGAFTYRDVTITSVTPVSGPIAGGNEVTIFGTDLAGATSVTFGGTEVTSIDENSATRIAVTVAAHALGLVDVVVTTPGGSDTEVNAYDFLDPVISTVVPDSGPSSGGTSVTITGTDLDDAAAVTFGGVAATDLFGGGTQGDDLDTHTSDTGQTWQRVSAGGQIFINLAFGPIVPNARTSGVTILTEYLWSAQGKDGILECFVKNSGGGQRNTGVFFRRNAGTEDRWIATLETAGGATDSVLRLQSLGSGGGVNDTVTVIGKVQGTLRVEFSGPEIKVYFDNILKLSVNNSYVQSDVGLGLHKPITGGGGLEEWDTLSFVDGGEITSNSTTEIVVTTPAGPAGLVDVEVTNPGGVTTEVDGYTYLAGGGTGGLLALQKEFLL